VELDLEEALGGRGLARSAAAEPARAPSHTESLAEARRRAQELARTFDPAGLQNTERDLVPFVYRHAWRSSAERAS
jgi:hypothetical protein